MKRLALAVALAALAGSASAADKSYQVTVRIGFKVEH